MQSDQEKREIDHRILDSMSKLQEYLISFDSQQT